MGSEHANVCAMCPLMYRCGKNKCVLQRFFLLFILSITDWCRIFRSAKILIFMNAKTEALLAAVTTVLQLNAPARSDKC